MLIIHPILCPYGASGHQFHCNRYLMGCSMLRYNFNNVLVGGMDIGMNNPFGELLPSPIHIAQVGVFGDICTKSMLLKISRIKPGKMGAYMGNSALNGWGTWKIQSYYKVLERDAWLDVLPDDDFYSGDTDTKGWRSQLDLGLAKNVWFTMSYFRTNVFKDVSWDNDHEQICSRTFISDGS